MSLVNKDMSHRGFFIAQKVRETPVQMEELKITYSHHPPAACSGAMTLQYSSKFQYCHKREIPYQLLLPKRA